MKKKVIIGIHGIGNKPRRRRLQIWWKKAISEGLNHIGHPNRAFDFEMAYWAHFLHPRPLSALVKERSHPCYIKNPYLPARQKQTSYPRLRFRKKALEVFEMVLDKIFLPERKFFNFDRISDFVIRRKFHDLYLYFHSGERRRGQTELELREAILQEVGNVIRKHKRKKIMLIAHSMGSIVAYDVLTRVLPDVKIHTFVTIGSPLGLPAVMKRFLAEEEGGARHEDRVPTPENIVAKWVNFSDLRDRVAINYNLGDDYKPNKRGVGPQDRIVHNDYENRTAKDPHTSYGYLRTPEVAGLIHEFLTEERPLLGDIIGKIRGLFGGGVKSEE